MSVGTFDELLVDELKDLYSAEKQIIRALPKIIKAVSSPELQQGLSNHLEETKGQVARLYGAYRDDDGTSERALFVIDGDGVIRWSYCSPVGVNPGADGILRALEALKPEATHG